MATAHVCVRVGEGAGMQAEVEPLLPLLLEQTTRQNTMCGVHQNGISAAPV